ncbi:predicted protein, partial [Nematostella vectensis]
MITIADDVIIAVFRFLDMRNLLSASLVCRRWYRLTQDSSLWTDLDLAQYSTKLQPAAIHRLLSQSFAPLGRRLSLATCAVNSETLVCVRQRCHSLHILNLN